MDAAHLTRLLQLADENRRAGDWNAALSGYLSAEVLLPRAAVIKLNIAVCYLGCGQAGLALTHSEQALALETGLWQAELVACKALHALGRGGEALPRLTRLASLQPENAEIRVELAAVVMHELGDAGLSTALVAPLIGRGAYDRDACLTTLMAALYEREGTADELTDSLIKFSGSQLTPSESATEAASNPGPPRGSGKRRRRVGLMSPMFSCSPVYFFCIGALRLLPTEVDLVFINRGAVTDWATQEFKTLASEWHDADRMPADVLAGLLQRLTLDVIVDLGGWSDPVGLRALAGKPVSIQYKWVGGQSATTGLHCFDGMLSDIHQSPPDLQSLYTEPLVLLDSGYVTYTAPLYMPPPVPTRAGQNLVGVISNPLKISRAFLNDVKVQISRVDSGARPSLLFIDKRYHHQPLRQRLLDSLISGPYALPGDVEVNFLAPTSHADYLLQVGRLNDVLDTFPYTGGLTTMEALALGVKCWTRVGRLFCERHTYAHSRYAGLEAAECRLDAWNPAAPTSRSSAQSLVTRDSPRLDHARLADELCRLFQ